MWFGGVVLPAVDTGEGGVELDDEAGCCFYGEKDLTMDRQQAAIVAAIQQEMHSKGYWMELRSPFRPGGKWFAGFTLHEFSGRNGFPYYRGSGDTALEAVRQAKQQFESDKLSHPDKDGAIA